jgi:large subunit ribosomal protein L5
VLELLTKQKCIATLSTRNLISWKLRKGMLVGCKVTLRKQKLDDFFDTLILTLPRMEKFKPWKKVLFQGKKIKPTLSVSLIELLFFYPIELGLGMNSNVKQIEFHFLFNTLLEEEKVFLLSTKKIPLSLK